jgi:hypothetical protein
VTVRNKEPDPAADDQVPTPDQAPPERGGVMRRLSTKGAGFAGAFSAIDQIYAPAHYDARQEIEEQRRVGKPAPAPTDPPDLKPASGTDPASRFRGRVVIRAKDLAGQDS